MEEHGNVGVALRPIKKSRRATWQECWRFWTPMILAWPLEKVLAWFLRWLNHPIVSERLASPIAWTACLLAGLVWHRWSPERRKRRLPVIVPVLALLIVAMDAFAVFTTISRHREDFRQLRALTTLPEDSLQQITIHPFPGAPASLTISDQDALRDFALSARDARLFREEPPRLGLPIWSVAVRGTREIDLLCYCRDEMPGRLFGEIGENDEDTNSFHFHVGFVSKDLRPWFEKYVENRSGQEHDQGADAPQNEQAIGQH